MLLGLSMPFFVKVLVAYIKDAEVPAWAADFFRFEAFDDPWLALNLPPNRQYGLGLAVAMVLVQGVTYILDENKSYGAKMLGAKASNALVAMLYEK